MVLLILYHVPQAFSKMESEVRSIVILASGIMALVLVAIGCITGCVARSLSTGISTPVNRLVGVVYALNRMDFTRQVGLLAFAHTPARII